MKNIKIRILNNGGYCFKSEHNRTFPVVVNGFIPEGYTDVVCIKNADAKAIGMYVTDNEPTFCLKSHPYGEEAEIVK